MTRTPHDTVTHADMANHLYKMGRKFLADYLRNLNEAHETELSGISGELKTENERMRAGYKKLRWLADKDKTVDSMAVMAISHAALEEIKP